MKYPRRFQMRTTTAVGRTHKQTTQVFIFSLTNDNACIAENILYTTRWEFYDVVEVRDRIDNLDGCERTLHTHGLLT